MGNMRKNYPAALKVKVALAALKGDKTLAQLSSEFGGHPHPDSGMEKTAAGRGARDFCHPPESRRTRGGGIASGVVSSNWATERGIGLGKKRVGTVHERLSDPGLNGVIPRFRFSDNVMCST